MYFVITASPNGDGLTAAIGAAAMEGVRKSGGTATHFDLCTEKISACQVCGNGWGICRETATCIIQDNLKKLQDTLKDADGIILVTPVYWGQPSERMKYFLDRMRRCNALQKENSIFHKVPISIIAAAGGSGNGTLSCLSEMELWCTHVGAIPKARMSITQFTRNAMIPAVTAMASSLATQDK